MSRCFPFPPPGYEREHKPEDLALLKEVKHKEKKHKKDKERRKDKEKKEKDKNGEKQEDKKDRKGKHKDKKEKHRDKKDKEDRIKDKDKSSISEESTVAGKLEERSGEKLHPKGHSKVSNLPDEGKCSTFFHGQNGVKPQSSQAINDAKFVLELDRRIRDEEKGGGSPFPERVASVDKSSDRDNTVHIKKMEAQRLDGEFAGKAMVENHTRVAKSKNEGASRPVEEQNDRRLDNKEKYKETGADKRGGKHKERDKKSHGKDKDKKKEKKKEEKARLKVENKKSEHEKSANVGVNDHVVATSNASARLLMDDRAALNAENHEKSANVGTNNRVVASSNVSAKMLMDDSAALNAENHEKSANVGTNNRVVASSNVSAKMLMDDSAAPNAENFRKRKAMDTNGFLHDSEKIRPNKVQSLALNQSTENGRKLETSHISTKSSSDKHPVPNHVRLDLDHRARLSNGVIEAQKPSTSKPARLSNGVIEAQKPSTSKPNSFITNIVSHQMAVAPKTTHPDFSHVKEPLKVPKMKDHSAEETPRRAPHPDSKYLSQVLTVPKMGDWSESDDQEWLFSKKGPPRRAHLELHGVNEEPRVWSEAVHVESADVYALPYVIPY